MYHGTTDIFKINRILPPNETGILREEWRKKNINKIYATTSLLSAEKYAYKATQKYGGNSIVYKVRPRGQVVNVNTNEYIADSADIIGIAEIYDNGWKKYESVV